MCVCACVFVSPSNEIGLNRQILCRSQCHSFPFNFLPFMFSHSLCVYVAYPTRGSVSWSPTRQSVISRVAWLLVREREREGERERGRGREGEREREREREREDQSALVAWDPHLPVQSGYLWSSGHGVTGDSIFTAGVEEVFSSTPGNRLSNSPRLPSHAPPPTHVDI